MFEGWGAIDTSSSECPVEWEFWKMVDVKANKIDIFNVKSKER